MWGAAAAFGIVPWGIRLRLLRRRAPDVRVEPAHGAAVNPLVRAGVPADVAGEAPVLVVRKEEEGERVEVGGVDHRQRHGGAGAVQVEVALAAVVEERGAVGAARVTAEGATGGEEGETVAGVGRVADALRHLGAGYVERVPACLARVGAVGEIARAAGAGGRRLPMKGGELQRVGVTEMGDDQLMAEPAHGFVAISE